MRKTATALCVTALGLLAVSTPGGAQTADSLGLISVGAILPYVGSSQPNGEMSILEVSAPVGPVVDLHAVLFDSSGARVGPSLGLPLAGKDVVEVRLDNPAFGFPTTGFHCHRIR